MAPVKGQILPPKTNLVGFFSMLIFPLKPCSSGASDIAEALLPGELPFELGEDFLGPGAEMKTKTKTEVSLASGLRFWLQDFGLGPVSVWRS